VGPPGFEPRGKKIKRRKKLLEVADTMRESLFSTAKSHVPKSPAFCPSNPTKTETVPVHLGTDMGAPPPSMGIGMVPSQTRRKNKRA